jgi:GNAT superfamily N-acetyltransferase
MNKDLIIRPASSTDLDAIAKIAEAVELFPGHMLPGMMAGYLEGRAADIWLVAAASHGPVAFAFCEPERLTKGTWNLLAIGVVPAHQGQGIGTKLMRQLEGTLRQAGHRILLVETLGTPEFDRTRTFYLANGFTLEARIREFYDVGGDKVVFWKHL